MNFLNTQSTAFSGKAKFPVMSKPPNARPSYPNRLRELRKVRGWSLAKLSEMSRKPLSSVQKFEVGRYDLGLEDIATFARVLGVSESDILPGAESRQIPVVGYVGAGAEVFPIDDFPKGGGIDEVTCPSNLDPTKTIAVIVRGDSMIPVGDGWILFYDRDPDLPPSELIGQPCIVKLANDGPMLVKQIRRGSERGRFNLLSSNAPMIENAEIEWAAPVRGMKPPEAGGA